MLPCFSQKEWLSSLFPHLSSYIHHPGDTLAVPITRECGRQCLIILMSSLPFSMSAPDTMKTSRLYAQTRTVVVRVSPECKWFVFNHSSRWGLWPGFALVTTRPLLTCIHESFVEGCSVPVVSLWPTGLQTLNHALLYQHFHRQCHTILFQPPFCDLMDSEPQSWGAGLLIPVCLLHSTPWFGGVLPARSFSQLAEECLRHLLLTLSSSLPGFCYISRAFPPKRLENLVGLSSCWYLPLP